MAKSLYAKKKLEGSCGRKGEQGFRSTQLGFKLKREEPFSSKMVFGHEEENKGKLGIRDYKAGPLMCRFGVVRRAYLVKKKTYLGGVLLNAKPEEKWDRPGV